MCTYIFGNKHTEFLQCNSIRCMKIQKVHVDKKKMMFKMCDKVWCAIGTGFSKSTGREQRMT